MSSPPKPVALITGAARRIGRSIALELARAGHDIVVHCNASVDDAQHTVADIEALGHAGWVVQGDLADPATPQRMMDEVAGVVDRLDVLVNNASIFEPMALEDFDVETWQRTMQINLAAPLQLCSAGLPLMPTGCIINLSDVTVRRPPQRYLAYGPSKAGLDYITRALAQALAPQVRVNAVAPGVAVFPDDYSPDLREHLVSQVPMKRAGEPQDVAAAVRFLVESPYITGQILSVDGGWV